MDLVLVTAPEEEPITLIEAKSQIRETSTAQDTLIGSYVSQAVAHVDGPGGYLGRAIITQTWDYKLDAFPCGPIKLPLPPLQSVTSVKYLDTEGVEQTMDAADYRVLTSEWFPSVEPAYGKSWPNTRCVSQAVTIRMVVGYGAAADVPENIKGALLLLVQYYEERQADEAIRNAAYSLLNPIRIAF